MIILLSIYSCYYNTTAQPNQQWRIASLIFLEELLSWPNIQKMHDYGPHLTGLILDGDRYPICNMILPYMGLSWNYSDHLKRHGTPQYGTLHKPSASISSSPLSPRSTQSTQSTQSQSSLRALSVSSEIVPLLSSILLPEKVLFFCHGKATAYHTSRSLLKSIRVNPQIVNKAINIAALNPSHIPDNMLGTNASSAGDHQPTFILQSGNSNFAPAYLQGGCRTFKPKRLADGLLPLGGVTVLLLMIEKCTNSTELLEPIRVLDWTLHSSPYLYRQMEEMNGYHILMTVLQCSLIDEEILEILFHLGTNSYIHTCVHTYIRVFFFSKF